jgi:hypothetical protein
VTTEPIHFNWPYATGWIEQRTGYGKALLTHSCTSALDLAALLLNIKSGDASCHPIRLCRLRTRSCCVARSRSLSTSARIRLISMSG